MLTDNNIWINPITVIKLFTRYILSKVTLPEDISELVKNSRLKPTTEAWRAAMYLLALEKKSPEINHYMQMNPDDPPDAFGLELFMRDGLLNGHIRGIEVFQYPQESELSFEEELKKKIDKAYDKDTVLICHVRKKEFKNTIGNIHESMKKLHPRNEIWIIGGSQSDQMGDQLVAKVFPNTDMVQINIHEVMNMRGYKDFIQGGLGVRRSMIFEPTGKEMILTPDFQIKELD